MAQIKHPIKLLSYPSEFDISNMEIQNRLVVLGHVTSNLLSFHI